MSDLRNNEVEEQGEKIEPTRSQVEIGGTIITTEEITPNKALKQLRNVVGEYEDYVSVQSRRKTDKLFRDFVILNLTKTNDKIKEIHSLLIEKQQMSTWASADALINDIGIFLRDVAKGDFGFTTFFENPKLLEMDISQLYLVDNEILWSLGVIHERTEAFMEMCRLSYFEDIDLWFETLNRILGKLIQLNDDRIKLIGSYERISY